MSDIIYNYTLDQAVEDGQLVKLSAENAIPQLYATPGVMSLQGKGFDSKEEDYRFIPILIATLWNELNRQPIKSTDGGNDQDFFSFVWRGTKFFVARNEGKGFTIMLPEEY